jgi:hypothetical protein
MTKRHGAILTGRLDNYAATTDPTVSSDAGAGYGVGSIWVNTTSQNAFICTDSTTGAAFWRCITMPPGTGNPDPTTQGIISLIPKHVFARATNALTLTTTTGNYGLVMVRAALSVVRVSFQVATAGPAGATARIALYSVDGQTKLIDGTAAVTTLGQKTFTFSAVALDPGYYYAFACRTDGGGAPAPQIASYASDFTNTPSGGPTASLIDIAGTLGVTAGAAPANFDPTSLTLADVIPVIRLDNA